MAIVRRDLAARDRGLLVALALSAATSAAFIARASFLLHGRRAFSLFDDAMISLTYARNLGSGHGLRWMPDQPAVEGVTNPLWTAWLAVPSLAGMPDTLAPLFVSATGAVLLVALVWTTWRIATIVSDGSAAAGRIAALTIALCYPLIFWTLRGMEVGLLALWVQVSVLLAFEIEQGRGGRGAVVALAVMVGAASLVRLDAVLPVGIIWLYLASADRRSIPWSIVIACACAAALVLAGQTAARLWYFHDWLPNTYYLKVGGSSAIERWTRGATMLATHLARELAMPVGLAAISPALGTRRGRLIASLAAAQMAYSVYVGGDAWDWTNYANRFVSIGVPMLIVLASITLADPAPGRWLDRRRGVQAAIALGLSGIVFPAGVRNGFWLDRLSPTGRALVYVRLALTAIALVAGVRALIGAVRRRPLPPAGGDAAPPRVRTLAWQTAALVIAFSGPAAVGWWSMGGDHVRDDELMTRVAVDLQSCMRPEASIAVTWAGSLPYFSHRPAIDLLGKSDPVIARSPGHGFVPGHDKWDYEYSIGRLRPDVILQLNSKTDADLARVKAWGYVPLPLVRPHPLFAVYVRGDTTAVNRHELSAALDERFAVR